MAWTCVWHRHLDGVGSPVGCARLHARLHAAASPGWFDRRSRTAAASWLPFDPVQTSALVPRASPKADASVLAPSPQMSPSEGSSDEIVRSGIPAGKLDVPTFAQPPAAFEQQSSTNWKDRGPLHRQMVQRGYLRRCSTYESLSAQPNTGHCHDFAVPRRSDLRH
jgi:hypothetical protein